MAGLKVWRVCSTKVRIVLLTCTFMKQVTYKFRGLDGHGHFCPILISFNRRAPNKYMAKFYISELKYIDKDIISNNLRNIWWLICWPASLFRYTFYTEFIHLTKYNVGDTESNIELLQYWRYYVCDLLIWIKTKLKSRVNISIKMNQSQSLTDN